jgi:branched-chain amino acid transport system ATP-binding protein
LRELSTADLIKINSREVSSRWNIFSRKRENTATGADLLTQVLGLLGEVETFASKPLAQLPTGIRRLVSVAAAVATRPRVLMLDEPAAGLSSDEAVELTRAIHLLRDNGVGVLVVDHNVGFVTRTCDHVHAMHFGKQIFAGTPEEMHSSPEVASVYLGDVAGVRS